MFHAPLALLLAQATPSRQPLHLRRRHPPAPPQPMPAFDFWVGEWDVYPSGKDLLVAHSKIEKLYAGCAIRENWMPLKGAGGGSLNTLDPADRTLVPVSGSMARAAGSSFSGGPAAGKMVLTGFWARGERSRPGRPGPDDLFRARQGYRAPVWRALDRPRPDLDHQFRFASIGAPPSPDDWQRHRPA